MEKELKRFLEITKYNYIKNDNQTKLFESFIDKKEINRYSHRMSEMLSLVDDDLLSESEDYTNISNLIKNGEFEVNKLDEFRKSLKSGDRGEFLTDYTDDEYGVMKTYKVKGYNVGFAIKSDGDIVSVHNNSGIRGIGGDLIQAAIKLGGTKLDHFDGFLTGLYQKNGFKIVGHDSWNDDYAPLDWKYEPVDIFNPQTSIYATELKKYTDESQIPAELKQKIESYKNGKPDIIYREL